MPYIKQEQRSMLAGPIKQLENSMKIAAETNDELDGVTNYVITKLLLGIFKQRRYATMARAIGCIAAVGFEFYRRYVAPYEDKKAKENGDVYPADRD
jgi:uncharacterized membrane protein YebE (DUF533 family)